MGIRPRRLIRLFLLAALCAVGFATPASAAQYCVGSTGTACGGGSYAFSAAGLTSALAAASGTANADEVRIAPGTIAAVPQLTIADANGVILTGAPGDATTLQINAGAGAAISMTSGSSNLSSLRIVGSGTTAIAVNESGFLSPASQFDHLAIVGYTYGFRLSHTGLPGPTVSDTLIDIGSAPLGRAIQAVNTTAFFTAQRMTMVGTGTAQTGVEVITSANGQTISGNVIDSLLYFPGGGATDSLKCADTGGGSPNGSASLAVTRASFYPSADYTSTDSGCDSGTEPSSIVSALDIEFVNSTAGDYHLLSFSAAIDKGDTARPTPATDLGGASRFVDGDGNGTPAVDLGAYEYQRKPPTTPIITVPQTTVAPGAALKFTAAATDPDPGDFLQYDWNFGDGTTANSSPQNHAFATLGTFDVTVTATDPTGLTASAHTTITVTNATSGGDITPTPTPGPGAGGLSDPTVLHVRVVTPPTKSIKRSSQGFATVPAAAPEVATLDVGGTVTLRVNLTRLVPGRRSSSKAKCKAGASKGKRCTARVAVDATAQIPVTNGTVFLKFGGKLGGKRLPAGTYEASVVPVTVDKKRGTPATFQLKLR